MIETIILNVDKNKTKNLDDFFRFVNISSINIYI